MVVPIKKCTNCNRVFHDEDEFFAATSRWRTCDQGHLWFNCQCNSTLMLPAGKFPFYDPSRRLSDSAAGIFDQIRNASSLPRIPNAILRLQQLCEHPNTSAQQLATIVRKDPAFAAEILKIAQRQKELRTPGDRPISELSHAIAYIGLHPFREMVAMLSLRTIRLKTSSFTHSIFWTEAYTTGLIAERLHKHFETGLSRDELYIAGCLCNIGKILNAHLHPEKMDFIHHESRDVRTLAPWLFLEQQHGIHDHTIMGEIAGALWGFPDHVLVGARYHHTPGSRGPFEQLPRLLHFAVQISHWLLLQPSRIEEPTFQETKKSLGLTDDKVQALVNEVSQVLRS